MVLAFVFLGFLVGVAAAGLALANGAGLFLAIVAYGAAGALTLLIPLAVHAFLPDDQAAAWDGDDHKTASA